jgi:glycosyltransferase involved in cell wall biosynthesis
MIRVLHLITTLQSGGAQAMLANLCRHARAPRRIEHVVVELTASRPQDLLRFEQSSLRLHSLGMVRGRISIGALGRFVRLLRRERPDLVQTWLYHADLLGLVARPVLRAPLVWNVRCSWHVGIDAPVPRLCARLSRLPTAVIVNSRAGQEVHCRLGYRPRRWCLIGNGFDLDAFKPDADARLRLRQELGIDSAAELIGIVGRWDANKDYQTFLSAAALLARTRRDAHFVLVGEGLVAENAQLQALIPRELPLGRVHLLGWRGDVGGVTAGFDLAACTSVGEGFPNAVGEAMAAGVPCVTTDVGDAADLVADPELVVPPRSPEALAAAWMRLLALGPEALQVLGARARDRISRHYSIDAIVGQYETLYQELAADFGRAR